MRFDKTDELAPGDGKLEVGLVGEGDFSGAKFGAKASYEHRLSKSISALAEAQAGYLLGENSGGFWRTFFGIRARF